MLKSIRLEDQIILFFFFFKCFIFPRVICCYNSSQLESCSSLFYSRLCLVRLTQRIGSAPMVNLVSAGGSEHTFRPARQRRCLLISPQRLCNVASSPSFSYKWVSKNGSWSTGAGTVPQLSVGGVRLCDSQNHRIDLAPLTALVKSCCIPLWSVSFPHLCSLLSLLWSHVPSHLNVCNPPPALGHSDLHPLPIILHWTP